MRNTHYEKSVIIITKCDEFYSIKNHSCLEYHPWITHRIFFLLPNSIQLHLLIKLMYIIWLVPDFGGRSLDTDPNFGQYRYFCGTIIDVCTDRNLNKMGTKHYIRQIRSDMHSFY